MNPVNSSVHKKLVHVFGKQSKNDHQAHRAMSVKTIFNEDPSNTGSYPTTAEKRPKELIRTMRHHVSGEPMWTNISISANIHPDKILSSAV